MGAASQELMDRAKLLISERRYQEAVRACRRALLSKPGQIEIRLLLGEALLALERYDEVRVEMMALARKVPDRGAVHRLLGEAYLRDGRSKQALESLQRALELDPSDDVAEELLAEAVDDEAPVSHTIERWFADEAEPTIETESPAWTEEATPVPGATHPNALVGEPSVQVDPSVYEAFEQPKTSVARPMGRKIRSHKATMLGTPAVVPATDPPSQDAPLPPPPEPGAPAPPTKSRIEIPRVSPPSAPPPPRPLGPGPRRDPSPFVPPPQPQPQPVVASFDDDSDDSTDELEMLTSSEIDLGLVDSRPRARPNDLPPPRPVPFPQPMPASRPPPRPMRGLAPIADPIYPGGGHVTQDIEDLEDQNPTRAFTSPIDDDELEDHRTAAHEAAQDFDPPTLDHYPAPVYRDTPYAEPERRPVPPEATPAFPSESRSEAVQPRKKRARTKKTWLLPAVGGGAGLLVLGGLVAVGLSFYVSSQEKQEIRAAAGAAGDSGSREAIEAVVARIGDSDDEELRALKARLLATLTFEHDQDHATAVGLLLAGLTAEEANTDAAVATALAALARADPRAADLALLDLTAQGEQIPEAFRARGYAMAALGDWVEAENAARQAVDQRPTSPRHIAFHALTKQHRTGETGGALTLLAGVPDGEHQPAIRIARARILLDGGSDPTQAVQEANAVIGELASVATPQQLSWAHLVLATYAIGQGENENALTEARGAAEHPPLLDESFGMGLVDVLMRAGAVQAANEQLARLPEVVIERAGRAMLTARVALALNDLDRAEQALGDAGAGNGQNLLRARIFEARGQIEAARPLYQRSMGAPGPERRQAAIRLASIETAAGHPDRVVNLLEPIQPEAVDDIELVPLLARAYLVRDRPADAQRIVDAALRRRPQSAELNAVRGAVLLDRGLAEEALAPLRTAVASRPEDAAIQADLGRAAHLAGHPDEAGTAWAAALAIDEGNPRALLGLGQLAFAAGRFDEARTRLDAAAARGGEELAVAQLRGQLLTIRGAGEEGAALMRPLSAAHEDAVIWASLGHLYAQAERDRDAERAYDHSLQIDRDHIDALLGRALVQTRRGDLRGARSGIDRATELAGQQGRAQEIAARVSVARGRLEFEDGDYDATVRLANEAIAADEHLAAAHLLIATIAIERGSDPVEPLRRAAAGYAPPPEALGLLAPRLPVGEEACSVARRYLAAAPRGLDASDVRQVAARCH